MANPTGKGGFKPGQSGNPGGRPREVAEVRDLARQHTEEAIATLRSVMRNTKAPAAARIAAANSILDRAYGRPSQEIIGDAGVSVALNMAPIGDIERAQRLAAIMGNLQSLEENKALSLPNATPSARTP